MTVNEHVEIGTKVLIQFDEPKSELVMPDSVKGKMPVDLCPTVVRVGPDCKKHMKEGDKVASVALVGEAQLEENIEDGAKNEAIEKPSNG